MTDQGRLPGTFFGPANLVALLSHRARCQPDDTAFIFLTDGENEQVRLTYRQLDRKARAIGAWLESLDLVGQRALLFYPPGLDFIAAFFGCLYAKVVAVPVYPPRPNQLLARLQAIAEDAEARVALSTRDVLRRVRPVCRSTPELRDLTWLATCDVPPAMHRDWQQLDVRGSSLAFLQYTSGSTGTPKGVMLSHTNLLHNSALIAHAFEHSRSGLGVFWLPNYHDMGLIGGILQPLYVGWPNVMMSPVAFLQRPYRWLSAISRFRATISGGPNFAYDLCTRKISEEERRGLDLSRWKVAFNGAEPVRAETIERFVKTFQPCGFRREAFYPCYGLAEATLIVSGGQVKRPPVIRGVRTDALAEGRAVDALPSNGPVRRLVSSGRTLPDGKIVIADPETTTRCDEGHVGEIWVRGLSVAQGYWRKPEATASTFDAYLEDTGEGPFLRTGDLGFLRDHELFVTGRVKDLIIVRGENHYPDDIEVTVERSHKRLRPGCGAVFAVEVNEKELLVVAHEVRRRANGDLKEVFDSIRRRVAQKHQLAVDAIVAVRAGGVPKTSSGKIQRHGCRDAWLAGSLPVIAQWVSPTARISVPLAKGAVPSDEPDVTVPEVFQPADAAQQPADEPRSRAGTSLADHFGGIKETVARVDGPHRRRPPAATVFPPQMEIPPAAYRIAEFPECVAFRRHLEAIESNGRHDASRPAHQLTPQGKSKVDGRQFADFARFDYLGLSGHPAVLQAAKDAVDRYGTAASGARPTRGKTALHRQLDQFIARFLGCQHALTFHSGQEAGQSVIGHLFGPEDLVLYDERADGGIAAGARLAGARRHAFTHNNFQAVDSLLRKHRRRYRRVLIAVEGISAVRGDVSNLPEFIDLKRRHKAILLVDETHSIGTLGIGGRGIGERFDVDRSDVELWTGTLANALGSSGGYLAGSRPTIEYLQHTTPAGALGAALSPADAGAALAAISLLEKEPDRVSRLHQRSEQLRALARQHRLDTGPGRDTPIVPIFLGNSVNCLQISEAIFRRGILVEPSFHPSVQHADDRLRFLVNATHTEDEIQRAIGVLIEELERIRPGCGRKSLH